MTIRSADVWRACRFAGLTAWVCFLAGCVDESTTGDKTTFTFSVWVPLAVVLGSIAATAVGAAVRTRNKRLGYVLLIGGPVALIVVAPGIFLDRVDIDRNQLTVRTGFWFMPNVQEIDLRHVKTIEVVAEQRRTRRGTRTDYKLIFHTADGSARTVSAGDLLKQSLPKITTIAHEQGIEVVDRTGT
ncbi:MAG TPA: hypothetical protein VHC22_09100 [Pirellulales bacterium]|nr:hypothetical protein [Pirellulales bacterium]